MLRERAPLASDFVEKVARDFSAGSLVFLQPIGASDPHAINGSAVATGSMAVVIKTNLDGARPGLFFLDPYVDRFGQYPKGQFIYDVGEPEPFNLQTLGIEVEPSVEILPIRRILTGKQRRPSPGELGFGPGGPYISTLTPQNIYGALNLTTWSLASGAFPPTFSSTSSWQLVWKCASGAEVVIPF